MLYCAMQPAKMNIAQIYCTYYAEKLSGQEFMSVNGNQTYECVCKLVPSINPDKVKVY